MPLISNETKFINDNIFKYEERLNSPLTRYIDKTPLQTTYFHINVNDTTLDAGFRDIEDILGVHSPLRFQKIDNFPIYGLEQIILDIQDSEEGLNTEYTSEGIIMPNTIKPLQNDMFIINHVKGSFIFRITNIAYDNIKADNFYKITFRFEYLDDGRLDQIEEQVVEKYTCVLENIGSEDRCIINSDDMLHINKVDDLYNDMVGLYKTLFYNERYNCFIGESVSGAKIYDPLQSQFMNKHKLLNKKNDYQTILLSEVFSDNKRPIKYEKSIYRFFERKDISLCNNFMIATFPGATRPDSVFARWSDPTVMVIDIPVMDRTSENMKLMPDNIVDMFVYNMPQESKYLDFMRKYIRQEDMSIYDIPLDLNEELLRLSANEEVFFYTPILIYIIKDIVNNYKKEKKEI